MVDGLAVVDGPAGRQVPADSPGNWILCAAQLTVNLADVATALDAEADVQEAPPLLAQQHQRLKHLLPKRLRLDELKRDACGTNGGSRISSVTLVSLSTGILMKRFYMLLSPEHRWWLLAVLLLLLLAAKSACWLPLYVASSFIGKI